MTEINKVYYEKDKQGRISLINLFLKATLEVSPLQKNKY